MPVPIEGGSVRLRAKGGMSKGSCFATGGRTIAGQGELLRGSPETGIPKRLRTRRKREKSEPETAGSRLAALWGRII